MNKILAKMLLLLTLSLPIASFGQGKIDWKQFLPGAEVDSILILSTNKGTWSTTEEGINMMRGNGFPLQDYASYLLVYEVQAGISDRAEIVKLLKLFPSGVCKTYSASRCGGPQYRDIVVFFQKGKAFFALKMCFSCEQFVSVPEKPATKCLANRELIMPIKRTWVQRGYLDLMTR